MRNTALIIVDVQNDFLPAQNSSDCDGALAVPDGRSIISVANSKMEAFDFVVATQDWHPADHMSFASQHASASVGDVIQVDGLDQVLWPDHCVQETNGAEFASQLNTRAIHKVVRKGTDRLIDSYSGFFDNARRKSTELEEWLKSRNVESVHILGLATDYCVKFTALDAIDLGFETTLLQSGCRGVELKTGDCDAALEEMRHQGVKIE